MGKIVFCFVVVPILLSIILGILNSDNASINQYFVHKLLSQFKTGIFCMEIRENNNAIIAYGDLPFGVNQGTKFTSIQATKLCSDMIIVNDLNAVNSGFLRGTIGLGETYFRSQWEYDHDKYDLGDILTSIFWNILNRGNVFTKYLVYLSKNEWQEYFHRIGLTKDKSQDYQDIMYHYTGYEFFETMFDKTFTYSCAYYNKSTKTLYEAQINHLDKMLNKLDLSSISLDQKNINILNIGFGWGYFENYITQKSDKIRTFNVTGISINKDQYKYVLKTYGNNTQSPYYNLMDFRDLTDKYPQAFFDRVLSIGVICHIHLKLLDKYFENIYKMLKPGGYFLLDGLVATAVFANGNQIQLDRRYGCQISNFLTKYIFPSGCALLGDWIHESAIKQGFLVLHREYNGQLYPRTLREWRSRLNKNRNYLLSNKIVSKKKYLSFEIYYAFAEATFRVGKMEQSQWLFYKPKKDQIHKYSFEQYEATNNVFDHWV